MERGLLWLPLLIVFFWLAWAGWNEYQKVETYRIWAQQFDRAKYDIYAVLGQKGTELTWGKPTRKGVLHLETFSLTDVRTIQFLVNDQPSDPESPPPKGRAGVEFTFTGKTEPTQVPFTEPELAAKWAQHLQQELKRLSP
jgi:hypothetical protein